MARGTGDSKGMVRAGGGCDGTGRGETDGHSGHACTPTAWHMSAQLPPVRRMCGLGRIVGTPGAGAQWARGLAWPLRTATGSARAAVWALPGRI